MSKKRHRNFKRKNDGLSPNQLHVLVGIILGRTINLKEYKRRYACVGKIPEDITWINKNVITALLDRNFINKDFTKERFYLTAKGFDSAYKKLKRAGIAVCNPPAAKKAVESAVRTLQL